MSRISIKTVDSRGDLLDFIRLSWKINANDPNWVPPLLMDRLKVLDKEKNPFFQHAEAQYFLALRDGKVVGRIAAIINEKHNEFHQDNIGFFGFLEGIEDREVFRRLLDTAADWLRERGKDRMLGPVNPSTNDEIGILIDGFDTPPYFMMTHNYPYYPRIMDELGFSKAKDVLAYRITSDTIKISDKLLQVTEATRKKLNVNIRSVDMNNFAEELDRIRQVYNAAWEKNWGFVPMTPAEFDFIAEDFRKILDPELVLLAEVEGKAIGFSLALPNYNEVFAKIPSGRLFPFGWLTFLRHRKKISTLRIITLGVIQKYQQAGIGGMFYLETFRRGVKNGYFTGEMSWILEDNELMVRSARLLGGDPYKTYRIYEKEL
ncbi:MAG: GNAT family N-acetyltransferase [Calditrichia bacterium]